MASGASGERGQRGSRHQPREPASTAGVTDGERREWPRLLPAVRRMVCPQTSQFTNHLDGAATQGVDCRAAIHAPSPITRDPGIPRTKAASRRWPAASQATAFGIFVSPSPKTQIEAHTSAATERREDPRPIQISGAYSSASAAPLGEQSMQSNPGSAPRPARKIPIKIPIRDPKAMRKNADSHVLALPGGVTGSRDERDVAGSGVLRRGSDGSPDLDPHPPIPGSPRFSPDNPRESSVS